MKSELEKKATVHLVDGVWKALPELNCDMFFGLMTPNEITITEDSIDIENIEQFPVLHENQIVLGVEKIEDGYDEDCRFWFKKTFKIIE